jgi:transposase
MRPWSERFFQWLRQVHFEHVADQVVCADYLAEVTAAGERVKRLQAALRQCAATAEHAGLIHALQAFRGIGFLSAVTIVAEVQWRCPVSSNEQKRRPPITLA